MSAYRASPAAAPQPRDPSGPYRVCLVCLGNICRSPMAEVVLREELDRAGLSGRVVVDSAGMGDWHAGEQMDPSASRELARRGYDGSGHRARQFRRPWLDRYDLVAAMDEANLRRLLAIAAGQDHGRVILFTRFDPERASEDGADAGVPDPYGAGAEEFALVFDMIQAAARGLAAQLTNLLGARSGQ